MTDIAARLASALADRYVIGRELGQGGMATVYLAEDVRHRRKVAVKVVHPELAAVLGAERFLSEIHVTAALQHPHILPLFDSGQAEGQLFYVMPYVEGESLRSRLSREHQLPIDDAVKLAGEVASALDYAHRHGVIHRDIKPENILLHDGQAMVADFGIALAVTNAGGGRLTQTGLSLGTPQYMSPEQATGERDIDARSDIYSLGAVTYEMLTGEPPFTGPTAQAIVAKVITTDPASLTSRRRSIPPHLEGSVLKALEKMPADRFASAAEFSRALAGMSPVPPRHRGAVSASQAVPFNKWRSIAFGFAGASALLVAIVIALLFRSEPKQPVTRFEVSFAGLLSAGSDAPAVSPDGSRFIYTNEEGTLLMRDRAELKPVVMRGTENGWAPFFSPDGQTLGFTTGFPGALKTVPVAGGAVTTLVTDSVYAHGGTWSDDGWIYFVGSTGGMQSLMRVRPNGENVELVAKPDTARNELFFYRPHALPGGRGVLVTIWRRRGVPDVAAIETKTGKVRLLGNGASAMYAGDNILVVVQPDGTANAVRFDPRKLSTTGRAVPVLAGIRASGTGRTVIGMSESGTMIYEAYVPANQIVRVDRSGNAEPIDAAWTGSFGHMAVSPDGRRIAIGVENDARTDVWVRDLASGSLTRLAAEGTYSYRPSWSPDGQRVLFTSDRSGTPALMSVAADGSSPPVMVRENPRGVDEGAISRDGKWVVHRVGSGSGRDIYVAAVTGDTTARPVVATPAEEFSPTLSPDGRWLAYGSDETQRSEIYVRPFPDAASARWQISRLGGIEPVWSHDGRELYYRSLQGNLMAVSVETGGTFRVTGERRLFRVSDYVSDSRHRMYSQSPDGRYFYFTHTLPGKQSSFIVVTNWVEELKARVAGAR